MSSDREKCIQEIRKMIIDGLPRGANIDHVLAALAGKISLAGPIKDHALKLHGLDATPSAPPASKTVPTTIAPQKKKPTGDLGDQVLAILEQGGGR